MVKEKFCCQICLSKFTRIFDFKQHINSSTHVQNLSKVYPNEIVKLNKRGSLPHIIFKDTHAQQALTQPILGLSQITLCFSPEVVKEAFYLCHICEQKCPLHKILSHIFHGDHYSNYFGYTDPEVLKFVWMPSMNIKATLMPCIKKELEKTGIGELQVLHLTEKLQKECINKTYSEVMTLLHNNEMLSETFKAVISNRTSIQTYKEDLKRKHPLVGLQHLVECVRVGQYEKRHYLCTLCNLDVASNMIIKHVLSFDHVFSYFNVWHPSTLMSKGCYLNYNIPFTCKMVDFAKQSQEINGTADLLQVMLEPAEFASVFTAGYAEAMKKLESITNKECSLIPIVKPGKKLEPTVAGCSNSVSDNKQKSEPETTTSANSSLMKNVNPENKLAPTTSGPSTTPSCSLQCQVCTRKFETDTLYFSHFSMSGHQLMFKKIFGAASDQPVSRCKPHLPLHIELFENVKEKRPGVGVSLVVTILSHQLNDEPIYVCFACEACILKNSLMHHLNSMSHFIQTLLYQNPWRLPFGWKKLDYTSLKTQAREEEQEGGSDEKMIKILDVPSSIFTSLFPLSFTKVMEKLGRCHIQLMNGIPRRETYSKLNENERFPLLGRDFLVKYGQIATGWKFLCLLCQRTLSADEYNAHVFSWEHVATFLKSFHPGSLDLSTLNEEILLDLAKQAARIHRVSSEQEILCDKYIYEANDYSRKVHLLSAEKARNDKGNLVPCITPNMKLVPRQTRTGERGNREGCLSGSSAKNDEASNQKCTTKNDTTVSEKTVAEGCNKEQCTDQENAKNSQTMASNKQPLKSTAFISMEKVNENENRSTSSSSTGDCDSTDAAKRPWGTCVKDPSSNETVAGESDPKRRRLSCPVPSHSPQQQRTHQLWGYIQRKVRNPLIGLSGLYECFSDEHALVYLCESCHQMLKEERIVSHLIDPLHYKNYLQTVLRKPLPQGRKWRGKMRKLAAHWENMHGYGEAQVVEMTALEFSKLTGDSEWYEAINIVRAHLDTEKNKSNICSTSPSLDGNRVETSVAANGQSEMQQVVKIDTDLQPQLSSEHATISEKIDITCKTMVKSISSEDLNLTSVQRPEHSEKTDTCLTVVREDIGQTPSAVVIHLAVAPTITTCAGTSQTASTSTLSSTNSITVIPEVGGETTRIAQNTSPNMEESTFPSCITATESHKPSKPVCKFISARSVTTKEPSSGATNEAPASSSCVTTSDICSKTAPDSFPTSVCAADTLTSNNSTITSTTAILTDSLKVTGSDSITWMTFSNSTKDTPKPQDGNAVVAPKVKLISHKATPIRKENSTVNNPSPRICKNDTPASHPLPTPTTTSYEPKTQTTEPSKKNMLRECPKVGLDQIITVTCKGSKHSYCLACLERLDESSHLISTNHQIKSVKIKFPRWTAKQSESKLNKMVALLAAAERALRTQCKSIEVTIKTYKELKALPGDKAIEKLRGMMKLKSSKNPPRPSVTSPCEISTSPFVSVSPYDITSPDFGQDNCETKLQEEDRVMAVPVKMPVSVKCAPRSSSPDQKPTSPQVVPNLMKGVTTEDLSNLSRYLKVKRMDEQIIGLGFVWECRVVPLKPLNTFYLCESCRQTLSFSEIFQHVASTEHQMKYMMRQYPKFMYWIDEDLLPWMKESLTEVIASSVSGREESMDAQVILLSEESYQWVRTAPFVEALKVVQRIKEKKNTFLLPPINTSHYKDVREKNNPNSKEALRKKDSVDAKERKSPLDVNAASSNADMNSCVSPKDSNKTLSSQVSVTVTLEPQSHSSQNPPKQLDVPSCSATVSLNTKPNLSESSKDEHQGLIQLAQKVTKACSNIPNEKDLFPAKSPSEPSHQSSLESTVVSPVNLAVTNSHVCNRDTNRDMAPGTSIQQESTVELNPKSCASTTVSSNTEQSLSESPVDEYQSPMQAAEMAIKSNSNIPKDQDLLKEKYLPQTSSESSHESAGVSPWVNSAVTFPVCHKDTDKGMAPETNNQDESLMDLHHIKLLIDLVKERKSILKIASNQAPVSSLESCTTNSSESYVQICESLKTATAEASNAESILTGDQTTTPNVNAVLSGINMSSEDSLRTANDVTIIKTDSPINISKTAVSNGQQTQEKHPVKSISGKNITNTQLSQDQLLQTRGEAPQMLSKIQDPHLQIQVQQSQTQGMIQQTQGQVSQLQSQVEVGPSQGLIQQVQGQMQQVTHGSDEFPIDSVITSRPHHTGQFNNAYPRQNQSFVSTSFQISQGLSTTDATTNSSNTLTVAGGYSQFVQTAYVSNGNGYLNSNNAASQGSAFPSQVYHQMQAQQFYTPVQSFPQSVQHPEASTWFNPGSQPQLVAQPYSVWTNGANTSGGTAGTSNFPYLYVPFNTPANPSYTNGRILMQNSFFQSTSSESSPVNSLFFPNQQ